MINTDKHNRSQKSEEANRGYEGGFDRDFL